MALVAISATLAVYCCKVINCCSRGSRMVSQGERDTFNNTSQTYFWGYFKLLTPTHTWGLVGYFAITLIKVVRIGTKWCHFWHRPSPDVEHWLRTHWITSVWFVLFVKMWLVNTNSTALTSGRVQLVLIVIVCCLPAGDHCTSSSQPFCSWMKTDALQVMTNTSTKTTYRYIVYCYADASILTHHA